MNEAMIPTPLLFTQSAASKVYELIKEEGNFDLSLRVFITGGGCSGFQYGFSFDEQINPDDTIIEKLVSGKSVKMATSASDTQDDEDTDDGGESGNITVKLLIDPLSLQYLTGAEIDYKNDLHGARFVIRNPNAKTTCGCGSSFSA